MKNNYLLTKKANERNFNASKNPLLKYLFLYTIIAPTIFIACSEGLGSGNKPTQLTSLPTSGYYIGSTSSNKSSLQSYAFGKISGDQALFDIINTEGSSFVGGRFQLRNNACFSGVKVIKGTDQYLNIHNCTFENNTLKGNYATDTGDQGTIDVTLNTTQLVIYPSVNDNYKGTIKSNLTSHTSQLTGKITNVGQRGDFNITNNDATINGNFSLNSPTCFTGIIKIGDLTSVFSLVNCIYQNGSLNAIYYYTTLSNFTGDTGTFTIAP